MKTSEGLRRRLGEMAEQLRKEFGPLSEGKQGCLLEEIEEWGVLLGDELARQLMSRQIAQEEIAAEESHCPKCHQMGRWKGQRKRRVETTRGAIHVSEPEYHCNRCRRSFFPSDRGIGDGA